MPLDSQGFHQPKRRPRRPTHRALPPIYPSAGIEVLYRRELNAMIGEMQADLSSAILEQWAERPPSTVNADLPVMVEGGEWLANDDTSAAELIATMRTLGAKWRSRFNVAAQMLARQFWTKSLLRVDRALGDLLRGAGWTVRFVITPEVRDAAAATIGSQVDLIKSIASEHLVNIQGSVMRSVMAGGDQGALAGSLERDFGIARRRAALIARDQNRKATATITRLRQEEAGLDRAIWMHSGGGREPRPEHVAFSSGQLGGPIYTVSRGAYLAGNRDGSDRHWTWPGWDVNCRCVSRCLVPLSPDAAQAAGLPSSALPPGRSRFMAS